MQDSMQSAATCDPMHEVQEASQHQVLILALRQAFISVPVSAKLAPNHYQDSGRYYADSDCKQGCSSVQCC